MACGYAFVSGALNFKVLFGLTDSNDSDEADVFLESRSSNTANLERNALVSSKSPHARLVHGIAQLTIRSQFFYVSLNTTMGS